MPTSKPSDTSSSALFGKIYSISEMNRELEAQDANEQQDERLYLSCCDENGEPRDKTGVIGIYGPSGLTVAEFCAKANGQDISDPAFQAQNPPPRTATGWIGIYGPSGYTVAEACANRKEPSGDSKL